MIIPGVAEGTPIVCRTCGGDMTLAPDLTLSCRYCGARDVLPPDDLGRALDIKNRLALAEQRSAQLRGIDAALASVFEDRMAFVRVAGAYFALSALIFLGASLNVASVLWSHQGQLSAQVVSELGIGALLSPLFVLGIAASLAFALARGRAVYRRRIRPLLLARPPLQVGVGLRCRTCGGILPEARSVDVRCSYCGTVNLIPKELHGSHAAALFQEADSARQRLIGINVSTLSITRTMRRTLYACGAVLLVSLYAVPALLQRVLE
jgi:DNA-directed RNA polymerase subunit RPC12/RpoP